MGTEVASKQVEATSSFHIAYVDIARALNEVEEGKEAKAKLKTEFEAKQKKLDAMQSDLKEKKESFDKHAGMMKAENRINKQQELQQAFLEVQKTYMQLQQELMESENSITQEIGKKLRSIVDMLGDRDGYTMILNVGDTVLYYKRHKDITDEVIQIYNKKHKKN
jgi:outer membrane protein